MSLGFSILLLPAVVFHQGKNYLITMVTVKQLLCREASDNKNLFFDNSEKKAKKKKTSAIGILE